MTFSGSLKFELSENINNLGENNRLTEAQKAEVLALIRQELKNP